MTRLRIVEVDKLCKSQAGLTAAFRHALHLQEKGWMRFPAPEWANPAVLAFDGEECVAGVNYTVDDDQLRTDVDFAFCSSTYPSALAVVLLRFRALLKKTESDRLCFTCHTDNEAMMKAVRVLKLEPVSLNYKIDLALAGEAGTAETPKSGSARRASTRRLKAGTPK